MALLDTKISLTKLRSRFEDSLVLLTAAVILYGLISTVSNDFSGYELLSGLLRDADFFESFVTLRFEFGSFLLLWIFSNLFSATMAVYSIGLIALSIKYYLFNKYLNFPIIAYFLYVLIFAHILDANQVRVALAACVIFYAIFDSPKSIVSYFFLSVVASLFHYSGVIILVLYFVRFPIIPLIGIVVLSFIFDLVVTSSPYLEFAVIWLSSGVGQVNLTNSFFIMQVCISIVCAAQWKTLTVGQKRGALINMVGVVAYISFLDNAIIAHRIRELSQLGIFGILFLGDQRLTIVKFVTSICVSYILGYNLFLILRELLF